MAYRQGDTPGDTGYYRASGLNQYLSGREYECVIRTDTITLRQVKCLTAPVVPAQNLGDSAYRENRPEGLRYRDRRSFHVLKDDLPGIDLDILIEGNLWVDIFNRTYRIVGITHAQGLWIMEGTVQEPDREFMVTETTTTIIEKIKRMIELGSGLPTDRVLLEDSNIKAPDTGYVTLYVISLLTQGLPLTTREVLDEDVHVTTLQSYEFVLSAQFRGKRALDQAAQCSTYFYSPEGQDEWNKEPSIAYYSSNVIQDLSDLFQDKRSKVAQLDFRCATSLPIAAQNIGRVTDPQINIKIIP